MPDLLFVVRSLWTELRRRKVFRVAGAYLGGAFVVLEGAQLTFGSLGVPDWGYTALVGAVIAGLPVALVLSWLFDLTPEGVQRANAAAGYGLAEGVDDAPAAPSATSARPAVADPSVREADPRSDARQAVLSRARLRRQTGVAAAVLLILLTAGAGSVAWRYFQAPPSSRELIAVLPFEVRGGSELDYLAEGMVDLLARNMDGVAGLRTLSPATVLSVSESDGGGELAPAAAAEVARRLGAGLYVVGSVFESPGSVRLDASILDSGPEAGEPVATARAEGAPQDLLRLVDELSAQLLAGVRPGQHAARLARTAATTTASLEALQRYLNGEKALRAAKYDSAIAAFQGAVEADSGFSLAHYRLAVAAFSRGRYRLARRASGRAVASSERLSERDRAIVAAFDAPLYGRLDEAERRYRAILRDYPDDMEATYQLAEVLFVADPLRARPLGPAGELYGKVLQSDPEFLCPI